VEEVGACDVVVIGAGFSGIYALYRLRRTGLSVRAFEAGDSPGWHVVLEPLSGRAHVGANIPGKARVFMVWVLWFEEYTKRCRQVVTDGFEGLAFT
jgi:cation diffusion facilitator CzcD-associated flavoprotein CzcO